MKLPPNSSQKPARDGHHCTDRRFHRRCESGIDARVLHLCRRVVAHHESIVQCSTGGFSNDQSPHLRVTSSIPARRPSVFIRPGRRRGNRTVYSEDFRNTFITPVSAQRMFRTYPLKDAAGNVVSNAYVIGNEEAFNNDLQDAVYIIRNVRPAVLASHRRLLRWFLRRRRYARRDRRYRRYGSRRRGRDQCSRERFFSPCPRPSQLPHAGAWDHRR